jgi:hypothetical protein
VDVKPRRDQPNWQPLATPEQFQRIAADLGVRVEVPYSLAHGSNRFDNLMFVPDFGSRAGMVGWFRDLEADRSDAASALEAAFFRAAKARGLCCSMLNSRSSLDQQEVKDTLDDWQYFGPVERRPAWYTGRPWTSARPSE